MKLTFAILLSLTSAAWAQTSQPIALEARANQAFAGGDYAVALPLLQKLADDAKNQPDRHARLNEQIQVCLTNLQSTPVMPVPATQPAAPADRKPHPAPAADEVMELSIKGLGNFQYNEMSGGNVPDDVKRLSGAQVRLNGFMIPIDQADNISHFALVPDLFACCFGQPPQLQHMVLVHCPEGKSVKYFTDEIVVEGTLKVEEKKEDDFIVSLFELDVKSVKPAVK